jgi:hypothetical protein
MPCSLRCVRNRLRIEPRPLVISPSGESGGRCGYVREGRDALPSIMAAIRMYWKLFALRTYRRRVLVTLLAFLGATVTVTQLVLWISGTKGGPALGVSLVTLAPVGVIFALVVSLPKSDITFRHDSATALVRVLIGDVFAETDSASIHRANPVVISR